MIKVKRYEPNCSRYKMFFKHFTRTDVLTPNVTSSGFSERSDEKLYREAA